MKLNKRFFRVILLKFYKELQETGANASWAMRQQRLTKQTRLNVDNINVTNKNIHYEFKKQNYLK